MNGKRSPLGIRPGQPCKLRYDSNAEGVPDTGKHPHFFCPAGIRCTILIFGRWENADFAVFGNLFDRRRNLVVGYDAVPVISNVLPVGEQADSVEGRLRWAYWQTRSGGKYGFLYILDCGMSDETAQICRRFAREYGNIEIGSLAQLEQRLTGGGDLQP